MNNDYDFDLLVSEEEFKKNKEIERMRRQPKKSMKKYENVVTICLLLFIVLIMFLTIILSIKNFDIKANKCDSEKGYTCSYYEVVKSEVYGKY